MFLFKKILSNFLFPLPFCLLICVIGLVFLWVTKRQRIGRTLVTLGVALLALLAYEPVANSLLSPLEQKYPPYGESRAESRVSSADARRSTPPSSTSSSTLDLRRSTLDYVLVLGGGGDPDPRVPVTSRLTDASMGRLIEGIRIYRDNPGSTLLLSGGGAFSKTSNTDRMKAVAVALGVPKGDIKVESRSRDTEDQARFVKEMIGTDRLALVTSASHLPRSVALLRQVGLDPIPAPARHLAVHDPTLSPDDFFPRSFELYKSQRAVYEYLGIAWGKLRGQIE